MHSTSSYFPRVKVYTQADGKVCIHPKSVNAEETEFNYTWLIYHLKMRTSSVSRQGVGWGRTRGGAWGAAVACLCLFWILCTSGEVDRWLKVVDSTSPALH